jgi:hypothetical protein
LDSHIFKNHPTTPEAKQYAESLGRAERLKVKPISKPLTELGYRPRYCPRCGAKLVPIGKEGLSEEDFDDIVKGCKREIGRIETDLKWMGKGIRIECVEEDMGMSVYSEIWGFKIEDKEWITRFEVSLDLAEEPVMELRDTHSYKRGDKFEAEEVEIPTSHKCILREIEERLKAALS